jgi:hypothetical protein
VCAELYLRKNTIDLLLYQFFVHIFAATKFNSKILSGKSSIARAALKGLQGVGAQNCIMNWCGRSNTVKKYLTEMGVQRQQSVIKPRLNILMQNLFFVQSIYKCVIDDESYFTVEVNEWQQQSY